MDHDELMEYLELEFSPDGFEFTSDKVDVMYAYHEEEMPVAVGAGAGTGKTTVLTKAVGEAILRQCTPSPETCEQNPFEEILVMTFMRDAANELKTTIKQVLRDHQAAAGYDLDPNIWRWVETESHISTINAFTIDLLREVAADAHVDPGFDIRDELETQELLRDVRARLQEEDDLAVALEFLEEELNQDDDPSPITFVYNIHQKLREFGDDFHNLGETFISRVRDDLHNGHDSPLDPDAIRDIVRSLTGDSPDASELDADTIAAIDETYRHNINYAEAVGDLVEAFEAEYDELTRRQGLLTYTDTTYLVLRYLESENGRDYAESLRTRFSHVFVDEFQDTSYAQCQILSHVLGTYEEEAPAARPQAMVIGDIKQAIYGWRSADPSIFAEILQHGGSDGDPDPYLGVADWTVQELTSNFRSHPHLVRAANGLFNDVFNHPGRGSISEFTVPYHDLNPAANNDEESDLEDADDDFVSSDPHLHILPLNADTADGWRGAEPNRIASTIRGVVNEEALTVEDDGDERPVRPGDVTMLFRASSRFREFRDALDRYGLQNAVVAEQGLFSSEEVSFVIDVLDWFANPHSKDSLLRILRSPITALDDKTLRFVASKGHDPTRALSEWPDSRLPASDRDRLSTLVDLRSDLRWDREDSKATLIQKIIQHTGIEVILLTGTDPRKRYGNLSMLIEVVRDWEEDDLLPYREFVNRLKEYREMATSGSEQFEVAQVADETADETVKLRTVHSAKGLEFDVVIIADMMQGEFASPISDDYIPIEVEDGERTIALHPREHGQQIPFNTGPGSSWVTNDDPSTLWLSEARDRNRNGALQYPHPYNSALTSQFAEYWRLLYVAFTRAADHLMLPLGDGYHWTKEWSWGAAMLDHFQPDDGWPDDVNGLSDAEWLQHHRIRHHPDDNGPATIPISCGELPTGDELPVEPIGIDLPELETDRFSADEHGTSDDSGEWEGVEFAPRSLRPSTLYDIIDCPRRYQYRALQDITDSHGESPEGTNNPPGISANVWGSMVHNALQDFHEDLRAGVVGDPDSHLERRLTEDIDDDAAERIREVIETYRTDTQTGEEIAAADLVLPEYHLSARHPSEPTVHISGYADLLYRIDGDWRIADFKTGEAPDEDADLFSQYRWQLATYVWLLHEEYGLEVIDARLVYVNSGEEKSLDLDWDLLSDYLQTLPDRLEIESEGGLPLNPRPDPETESPDSLPLDSRCGACPYTEICPAWQD